MGFRSLPQLLWSNLAATVHVRARKVIVGSGMALTDNADGSATISATGTNTLAADTDVVISSPADTEVLTYDSGSGKWKNAAASGGGGGGATDLIQTTVGNQTGGTLTKGTVVSSDAGVTSGVVNVFRLTDTTDQASSSDFMGVLTGDIVNGATGTCTKYGLVSNLDTSLFTVGTFMYAGTAGALTDDPSTFYHRVGTVITQHATTGSIFVNGDDESAPSHSHSSLATGSASIITALTADATPDSATDYVRTFDASAGTDKKVLLANLPGGGGGDVATDVIWDAKGDLAAGTGANTAAKVTVGADDTILMADSAQTTGLKWVASATPSTQAFGDSAAVGTADTYTRGDHKHGMPAAPTTVATDTIFDAKGDLAVGTDADTSAKLTVGTNDFVLTAASGETTGLKWAVTASDSSKAPVASPTFTGITTAPEFSASGLTGAVSASRYVGATASGAPVSGTFVLGDWIAAQDGIRWTCTVGGTPGTWVQEPGTGGGSGLYSAYLCYQEQQAQNTNAGTFTSGADRTRVITTEVADSGNHGSLASNQITLDAGTYDCIITAPALQVDDHQAWLFNTTTSATLLRGSTAFAGQIAGGSQTDSVIAGRFVLAGSSALEIRHRCVSSKATFGFGIAANFGTEIYTTATFWRV